MTKNGLLAGIIVGLGIGGFIAPVAIAEIVSPLHSGNNCTSQIQLPQDKEDLSLNDVKHAVKSHLLRIGAEKHEVRVSWYDEEIITVNISHNGHVLRRLKVDAANAEIVERKNYRRAVGFEAPQVALKVAHDNQFVQKVRYSRQLRRHMLGDGKSWASWIGARKAGFSCLDDYRFGGPRMAEPGS